MALTTPCKLTPTKWPPKTPSLEAQGAVYYIGSAVGLLWIHSMFGRLDLGTIFYSSMDNSLPLA